ncbi:hypothetical protein Tco_0752591 [Tanacetum coccineum]|uniref:Uncharacterized protein n=1 Tax=Tanacetum coccineum TaxID=301880 RepID=A0ABQ4ZAJ7_9ASTR
MYNDTILTHPLNIECVTITYRLIRCYTNVSQTRYLNQFHGKEISAFNIVQLVTLTIDIDNTNTARSTSTSRALSLIEKISGVGVIFPTLWSQIQFMISSKYLFNVAVCIEQSHGLQFSVRQFDISDYELGSTEVALGWRIRQTFGLLLRYRACLEDTWIRVVLGSYDFMDFVRADRVWDRCLRHSVARWIDFLEECAHVVRKWWIWQRKTQRVEYRDVMTSGCDLSDVLLGYGCLHRVSTSERFDRIYLHCVLHITSLRYGESGRFISDSLQRRVEEWILIEDLGTWAHVLDIFIVSSETEDISTRVRVGGSGYVSESERDIERLMRFEVDSVVAQGVTKIVFLGFESVPLASRLFRSMMSFHQALDMISELNETTRDRSPRVSLGMLLPHARGPGFESLHGGFPSRDYLLGGFICVPRVVQPVNVVCPQTPQRLTKVIPLITTLEFVFGNSLFAMQGDKFETIFQTRSGHELSSVRLNIETLAPRLWIDLNVVDCWVAILNHEELTQVMIEGSIDEKDQWKVFSAEISTQFKHDISSISLSEVDLDVVLCIESDKQVSLLRRMSSRRDMIEQTRDAIIVNAIKNRAECDPAKTKIVVENQEEDAVKSK